MIIIMLSTSASETDMIIHYIKAMQTLLSSSHSSSSHSSPSHASPCQCQSTFFHFIEFPFAIPNCNSLSPLPFPLPKYFAKFDAVNTRP